MADKVAPAQEQRMVTVCGWCPDAQEQTEAARAHGFDVSHTICSACEARWNEQAEQKFGTQQEKQS
jgi:hypothetical protein